VADTLRIAIAGTGFGQKYAIGLAAQPEVEIVGVFSRRLERAQAMAKTFGIPTATRNFEELLQIPYLNAVAVVTPNNTHAEFIQEAIRARKHVICDKPLALDGDQAEELSQLAETVGVRNVTFVPYRFSPASIAVKAGIDAGHVGRTISVRAGWAVDMRDEPLRWRFQRKLSGAGVAADLGAHILDLLMWWVGPIRRVLGRCNTLVPERPSEVGGRRRPVDVPDECWALLEFDGPGIGSVKLSWNAKRNQTAEIEGDRGRISYESPSLLQWLDNRGGFEPTAHLALSPEAGRTAELPLDRESFDRPEAALGRMFRDVVSYLKGGEKPDCVATFQDGAAVMRVIDALETSDRRGAWVDLAEDTE